MRGLVICEVWWLVRFLDVFGFFDGYVKEMVELLISWKGFCACILEKGLGLWVWGLRGEFSGMI